MKTPILDQLSTSQTFSKIPKGKEIHKDRNIYDVCMNNAPYFAYQITDKKWGVVQGCCNNWNCPRCGQQRAKEEYGRIVEGCRAISENDQMYLMTITCRGKDCSLEEAENGYLKWTNNLLTRLRISHKRANKKWVYASVTERQMRLHPHSHYITTYCPDDVSFVAKGQPKIYFTTGQTFPAKHDTLQTKYLERACVQSGLGFQYDLSKLDNIEGASRYVAKYLFKADIFETIWPKGWKRVRYSQNFPKLPEKESKAIVLITAFDWYKLSQLAVVVVTNDNGVRDEVRRNIGRADLIIQ